MQGADAVAHALNRFSANSFATSCASRALTFRRACCIAVFTEFTGAVLLGSNVAKTIKGAWLARAQSHGAAATGGDSGVRVLCFLRRV